MHKWQIRYILKSGNHLFGVYRGPESTEDEVLKKIWSVDDNHIHMCNGSSDNGRLYVKHGEIAAVLVVELVGK